MDSTSWKRAKQVFHEALEKGGAERTAFVTSACGKDRDLRVQVDALLAAHDDAGEFLVSPTLADADETTRVVAELAESPPAERPGAKIGPYKLLQVIGEGGFGVVYMAEQEEPVRRRVALKVIKLGMDTREVIARFEAERQALALMEHPNIARVLDAGATETGRPYFVMELVKGIPITEYCDGNRLTTRQRLDLFTEICSAVQHAHQKGIVHRDLKPSNVLVTLHDGKPVPKVIDFGIAKAMHQRLTEKTLFTAYGQFIGTPVYMSPEQAELSGLDIDTRSDIYSLGVLLYELLTGTTPFDPTSLREAGLAEIQRVIREEEPPRPSTRLSTLGGALTAIAEHRRTDENGLRRLVRGDLDWIVMKSLEKDRTRRYASASEFAADVGRHLGDEPVVARPPSTAYLLRKYVRKHRGPVAAVGAVVLTALALGSVAFWQGRAAQRQAARVRISSIVATATVTEDPLLKALLALELAEVPEAPGRLNVASEAVTFPLPVTVFRGHEGYVNTAKFSSDGSRILTCARDGTARIWRVDGTGQPIVLRGHQGGIWDASFSPDGRRVATASDDGTARIWNADGSGDPVVLEGHGERLWAAEFSPDGTRVVTAAHDKTARVWSADGTGEPVVLRGHDRWVRRATFSPDGTRVLTVSRDGTARVWPADGIGEPVVFRHDVDLWQGRFDSEGRRVVTTGFDGTVHVWNADGTGDPVVFRHDDAVWDARFDPEGKRIVSASADWTARVWSADGSGEPITLRGHQNALWTAMFSPDGSFVLTAADDGTARVWKEGHKPVLLHHQGPLYAIDISRDGDLIVTGSALGPARVWRTGDTGATRFLRGVGNGASGVEFSPDGRLLLVASGEVQVWPTDGPGEPVILSGHDGWVKGATFGPRGRRVATISGDGKVRLWQSNGAGEALVLDQDRATRVAFSPDWTLLASGSEGGTVSLWPVDEPGEPLSLRGHEGRISSVRFSPDGTFLVTASEDGTARIWRADGSGEPVVLKGHEGALWDAVFSPDGTRVATISAWDNTMRIWRPDGNGEPLIFRRPAGDVRWGSFSPDGNRIVTGSSDGPVVVWTIDGTAEPIVLRGHTEEVWTSTFSPDGTLVASASGDSTARVWRADGTGEPLILQHDGWVEDVKFSPDGTRVATASWDGFARIWEVTWPRLLAYLRAHVNACLTPEQRRKFLAEEASRAWETYAACERSHGRNPGTAP